MSKELKTTVIPENQIETYNEETGSVEFNAPSKFYVQLATGDYLFFHTRNRLKCVDYVKEHFDGKYTIRTAKQSSGNGEYSAKGSNSRKGFASNLRKTI